MKKSIAKANFSLIKGFRLNSQIIWFKLALNCKKVLVKIIKIFLKRRLILFKALKMDKILFKEIKLI